MSPDKDGDLFYEDILLDEQPDLGPCCACGCEGPTVRNLVLLDRRSPVPGTGWGCLLCGLPTDGALALVCDACLESRAPYRWALLGHASVQDRIPIEALGPEGEFAHRPECHPGEVIDGR